MYICVYITVEMSQPSTLSVFKKRQTAFTALCLHLVDEINVNFYLRVVGLIG